ncbi:phosphate ABC transporter substrate-binding protein PstS [Phenylobacterium soli]|uniref:Phosphate-binding protein PstS n=1 Tax=Phenylobacterium soli TaxID=2170551 RepID=A0A328ANV4_9CAUL|nr:phosphate ABC transporter substrate-binding protein PstS [Phenylobacterium soli]RAK55991.1 phosphate ABC transporter substrate-binding protein PstS [Phenylobacterium soli]
MIRRVFLALAATAALAAPLAGCSGKGGEAKAPAGPQISGAGATFPAPLYAKWAEAQKQATGLTLNYQAIGSGGGIKQIEAKTVAFGASDKPLKPEDLEKNGLLQFPTVMGGVVPVANLPGVTPGGLKLTGPLLADIYLGKVTKWSDPAIAALNAGAKLPNLPITVVHRSDGSGTSFLFTSYLTTVAPQWAKVGASDSVAWPAGLGGKGNDGVAAMVKQTPGAIGYVEYAYAKQNGMTYALLQNASGAFVAPTAANFAAAAAGADWTKAPGFYLLLLNQPGKDAWPITGATFILMHRQQSDAATAKAVLSFYDWAFKNGDAQAQALDYVPLPDAVKTLVRQSWSGVVGPDGKPVYQPAS